MSQIVLASSSPFRKELLQRLHLTFETNSPDIDEAELNNESPSQLVIRLSRLKAEKVAQTYPAAIIIGSDQVAVCDGKILGKPGNLENATKQLKQLSGKQVVFHTGLCVFNAATKKVQCEEVKFFVTFRELSHDMIENYLTKEPAFNCAGSFKSEALGVALTSSMSGEDPTALVGLPLIRLTQILDDMGISVI